MDLTPPQQTAVEDARAFLAAAKAGRKALAARLQTDPGAASFYPLAYAGARVHTEMLLRVIAELTGDTP